MAIDRWRIALAHAACALLFLLVVTPPALTSGAQAGAGEGVTAASLSRESGPAVDSVIHLKQWQAQYGGNGHWYGILAVLHDWLEADSVARALSLDTMLGYLASIQGASENYFIFDSVLPGVDPPSIEKQYLLGGRKVAGAWQWTTGEPLCYQNWASGEPNNPQSETVISMWGPTRQPQPNPPGGWNNTSPDDAINPNVRFWAVVEWGPLISPLPTCGDGNAECGEECDDGNITDNDGCNSSCESEICGDGVVQPWEECDDGNLIAGDGCDPTCHVQVCGNGILEPGEECDDGNLDPNDSCNAACDVEHCRDGAVQPWEECDDGNSISGDGCDPACRIEACGNGRVDAGECCDDSNVVGGDGCSAACLDESVVCGDGAVGCSEVCDDGNELNGDGCESNCQYTCTPGDVNLTQTATSSDVIILLNYVFLRGGPPKPCWSAGDMNCNGVITSADIITLINHLFKSGTLAECDRCARCGP
jgi:cysteine-rich repeat protein